MERTCKYLELLVDSHANKSIIILGDFNCPDINWATLTAKAASSKTLLDFTLIAGLGQVIDQPTRPSRNGGNILDLLFTNCSERINTKITPGLSDHDTILFQLRGNILLHKNPPLIKCCPHKADFKEISTYMSSFCEDFFNSNPEAHSVNENWSSFKEKTLTAIHLFSPTQTFSRRWNLPWVSRDIKQVIKQKDKAYKRYKLSPSNEGWAKFSRERSAVKKLIRNCKTDYLNKAAMNSSSNKRNFFKILNNKTRKELSPFSETGEDLRYSRIQSIAEHFATCITRPSPETVPILPILFPNMPDIIITDKGVKALLTKLDVHKSTGPDGIPPIILKNCAVVLYKLIAFIIQQSLHSGEIPPDWKKAHVVPIHKGGNKNDPNCYRPISLTCILSKLAEHIVASSIWSHIDKYSIITPKQFGFRRGHSTEALLITCLERWTEALDQGLTIDIIFLDFRKASDSVWIDGLKTKLRSIGIRGPILRWIDNFLSQRSQCVVGEAVTSGWHFVSSGVPQGSVLGPLLFLIYINDIVNQITADAELFADDLAASKIISSQQDVSALQCDLDKITQWTDRWALPLNPDKCVHLRISRSRSLCITDTYFLMGVPIKKVNEAKYLGITITKNLSWNPHIDNITSRASQKLGFLKRALSGCSSSAKEAAVNAIIRPSLEYASSVWDPGSSRNITKLEAVQRKSARFVCRVNPRDYSISITNVLKSLKWPSLQIRRKRTRILLFRQIMLGRCPSLESLRTLILPPNVTRHCDVHRPFARTNARFFSFIPRTAGDWIRLPHSKLQPDTKSQLKEYIDKTVV